MPKEKRTLRRKPEDFKKNIFRIAVLLAALAVTVVFGLSGFVRLRTEHSILPVDRAEQNEYDCILVLGAGVNGQSPSMMLRDRLDTAIALYKAGVADKIVMSGDHGGNHYNEVGVMKTYAMEQGVPSSDVFMDHAGFSTYESLYRVKTVFGCQKVLVVTQTYHLYRALYLGKGLSLTVAGVSADRQSYRGQLYRDVREVLARDKDVFTAALKPAPTVPVGESIPITGDGDVTNDDAFFALAAGKNVSVSEE